MPKIEADVVLALGEHLPAVDVWLVVDVLRASTVIVRWFELGGGALLPVDSTNAARRLATSLIKNKQNPLLMGEENAIAPKGFDVGNSPLDLTEKLVKSHSCAVMATTNGTSALLAAAATGVPVLTACVRNATAAVTHALTFGSRIGILCAGRKRRPAWDDTLCAGLLLETLAVHEPDILLTDSARLALLTLHSSPSILRSMRGADHAIFLDKLGYGPDIEFACERNAANVVPVLREEPVGVEGSSETKMRAVLEAVTVTIPDDINERVSATEAVNAVSSGRSFKTLLDYARLSSINVNDEKKSPTPAAPAASKQSSVLKDTQVQQETAQPQPFFYLGGERRRDRLDHVINKG